jgi:hypothetical protein
MIDRHVLRGIASSVVGPFDHPVTVEVVSMSKVEDNTPASMCWLSKDEAKCRPASGYPLEPGTKVEIDLFEGEELWAVTMSIGLLAYSVKGYRGRL